MCDYDEEYYSICAIEYPKQGGRRLQIFSQDILGNALLSAHKYINGGHNYKHIDIYRMPDNILIWRDREVVEEE